MTKNNDVVETPQDDKAESTVDSQKITKLKGQLRAQAERIVVQRHQDEYHEEASRLFAEHGLEFTRRLNPEEKAKKQLQELLAAHPDLAGQINAVAGNDNGRDEGKAADTMDPAVGGEDDDTPAVLNSNSPF